jgi:hypothetical protein
VAPPMHLEVMRDLRSILGCLTYFPAIFAILAFLDWYAQRVSQGEAAWESFKWFSLISLAFRFAMFCFDEGTRSVAQEISDKRLKAIIHKLDR